MADKMYKIIWCDDQHEKMNGFKLQARQEGIELICFKSSQGIEELERNYQIYDGVLLDAKFFQNENDAAGTESIKALAKAKDLVLKLPKVFKPFVLTGQSKLFNDDTFNSLFPNYYRKGIEEDIIQLFNDLKREADKQIDSQIKHDHKNVFEVFTNGYLPNDVAGQVLSLIKCPLPKTKSDFIGMLTNIRNIQESCFVNLEKIGLVADSNAPISSIIWYLSGSHTKDKQGNYKPTTHIYQNGAIENLHKWIYFTCGSYIHYLKDENYNKYMISNYAIESLRNGILELLLWYKQIYKENT